MKYNSLVTLVIDRTNVFEFVRLLPEFFEEYEKLTNKYYYITRFLNKISLHNICAQDKVRPVLLNMQDVNLNLILNELEDIVNGKSLLIDDIVSKRNLENAINAFNIMHDKCSEFEMCFEYYAQEYVKSLGYTRTFDKNKVIIYKNGDITKYTEQYASLQYIHITESSGVLSFDETTLYFSTKFIYDEVDYKHTTNSTKCISLKDLSSRIKNEKFEDWQKEYLMQYYPEYII